MRGRRWKFGSLALVALLLLPAAPTLASTFVETDLATLTLDSEAVVHGLVLDMQSAWNEEHSMIFTEVTVEVARVYRGQAPAVVKIRVPGGTVDGFGVRMHGGPQFRLDTEVLVFLDRWENGDYRVCGYYMGLSGVRVEGGRALIRGGLADGLPLQYLQSELRKVSPEFRQQRNEVRP